MNMKRMRGRGYRQGGGAGGGGGGGGGQYRSAATTTQQPMNRNHSFDSSGPDLRLRGTAQQLFEKYLQLGRDATGGGDRVMAEAYFQHAEHYFRILGAMNQAQVAQGGQSQAPQGHNQNRRYQQDENGESAPEGEAETVQPARSQEIPQLDGDGGPADLEAELAAETLPNPRDEALR